MKRLTGFQQQIRRSLAQWISINGIIQAEASGLPLSIGPYQTATGDRSYALIHGAETTTLADPLAISETFLRMVGDRLALLALKAAREAFDPQAPALVACPRCAAAGATQEPSGAIFCQSCKTWTFSGAVARLPLGDSQ